MNKYKLKIDGMMCSMCETHVNEIVRKGFKVYKTKSNHSKNEVVFTTDEILSEEKIKNVFEPTGYKVLSISIEENVKKKIIGI
jgi:copper chaperone CopZ